MEDSNKNDTKETKAAQGQPEAAKAETKKEPAGAQPSAGAEAGKAAEAQPAAPAAASAPSAQAQPAAPAKDAASKEKAKPTKPTNCAKCGKAIKLHLWYYRNGQYYCNKRCWKLSVPKDKESKEEAPEKA